MPSSDSWTITSFSSLSGDKAPSTLSVQRMSSSNGSQMLLWTPGVSEALSRVLGGPSYFQRNIISLWG